MKPINKKCVEIELRLLPGGQILVHNLTPAMARVLNNVAPGDARMKARAECAKKDVDRSNIIEGGNPTHR